MFTSTDLQARIRRRPFEPLRIVTSSGESFEVSHPELIMVGRRELIIGTASSRDPRVYEQWSEVALMHVTAIEKIPTRGS